MINKKIQKTFFNNYKYQYANKLILHPPIHTKLEINQLLKRINPLKKRSWVIDFGAGTGRLTIPLLLTGYQVIAVDISKNSLNRLKKTAKTLNLNCLKTTSSLSSRYPSKAVVGTDILHHIELTEFLPKLYKTIKRKTKIVFIEPGAGNLFWYLFLPLFVGWEVEKGVTQCSYFNLVKQLKIYGFKKIKVTGLGFWPRFLFSFSSKLCQINDSMGNIGWLKLFAYRYIIEAEK